MPLDLPCSIAEADLSAYVTKLGPVGAALRDADEATRARIADLLRDAFTPLVRDGVARVHRGLLARDGARVERSLSPARAVILRSAPAGSVP